MIFKLCKFVPFTFLHKMKQKTKLLRDNNVDKQNKLKSLIEFLLEWVFEEFATSLSGRNFLIFAEKEVFIIKCISERL